MSARIYQTPKNAMQSGRALTDRWNLEFEQSEAKQADPLTGWAGSGDTKSQLKLKFATQAAAEAYAKKHGIDFAVVATPSRTLKIQAYSDNFG